MDLPMAGLKVEWGFKGLIYLCVCLYIDGHIREWTYTWQFIVCIKKGSDIRNDMSRLDLCKCC